MLDEFDWNDLKALLAAAEAGSLSAAAAKSGAAQPTLGRRIDALEAALGLTLFERGPRGMALTAAGTDIAACAREVRAAAARLSLAAAGRSETLTGTVRITASEIMSAHHLPAMLARLLDAEPGVEVELVASNAADDLLLREADIAVRMFRPRQPGLIARKVADMQTALYASHDYLARRGQPTLDDWGGHRMVGYDRDRLIERWMTDHGMSPPPGFFRLRTDDQIVYWRLVVSGGGIGANQRLIGDAEPGVARVLHAAPMPVMPVWLTCHAELRTSALIRRVFDFLGEELAKLR